MAMDMSLGNLVVHLRANSLQFERTMARAQATMLRTSQSIQGAALSMSLGVTVPLALIAKRAVDSFSRFDSAMTQSTAIMGDMTATMRKEMERTALELSGRSRQSADELAQSYFFLASAGLDAEKSIAALPVVTKFATAGMFDMAKATDLLTDAQSALGMSVDDAAQNQENMIRLSDTLVRANTLANATVEQFSEALTNDAAAAMKSYNISMEEGVAVLASYADQGTKGLKAGAMFGRMTRLLIKSVNENEQAFTDMNIAVKDQQGNLMPLANIIEDINNATKDLGATEKAAALETLGFQARVQQTILPLLGTSNAIRRYHDELKDASGFTDSVASKQMESFANQMKVLGNQLNLVGIEIGKALAPSIGWLSERIKGLLGWWNELSAPIQRTVVYVGMFLALLGPGLFILSKFIALGAMFAGALGAIAGIIPVLITGIGAVTAFAVATAAAVAPWLLLGGAIATVIGLLITNTEEGVSYMRWLGDTFEWWYDLVSGLISRFQTTWAGMLSAFQADNLGLAVQIMWNQIKMEWAAGVNAIAESWGWLIDMGRDAWFDILTIATTVAEGVSKTFWESMKFIADAITDLMVELKDLYNNWRRITGAISDVEERQLYTQTRQWRDSVKRGIDTSVQNQIGISTRFYQDQLRGIQQRDRTPFALQAQQDFQAAQMEWGRTIKQAASEAATALAPEREALERAQREQSGMATTEVSPAGSDIALTRGSFLAAQLTGAAGADPAQNVRQRQLNVQEGILEESRKTNRNLENTGSVVLG